MRKILNLVKCEFIKNYTFLKVLLVLIVLMISVIIASESSIFKDYGYVRNPKQEIERLEQNYQGLLEEDSVDKLKKEFALNKYKKLIEIYQLLEEKEEIHASSWQDILIKVISDLEDELFIVKGMQENPSREFVVEESNGEVVYFDSYKEAVTTVKKLSQVKSLKELENDYKNEIDICRKILQENKFYKYIEYRLQKFEEFGEEDSHFTSDSHRLDDQITEENKKYYKYIVSQKLEDEKDIRALNFIQLQKISNTHEILSEENWKRENGEFSNIDYKGYVRYIKAENNIIENENAIILYSFNHEKKHDLELKYQQGLVGHGYYHSTKAAVNQVLNLSVVILLLVIITSSGIISGEHSNKTEKTLLITPIKRYKVFFSKFLYLILHTYLIWLVAFFLIFLYSGIRFGFADLFTSKLIYHNGVVEEVNYIFYMVKMIFINGIPVIAILSILFMLSTITLNTAVTASICTVMAILSCWLWQYIVQYGLFFLVYTPFPYMNLYDVQEGNNFFLETLQYVDVSWQLGLFVSLITILICYVVASLVYIKRDVKN